MTAAVDLEWQDRAACRQGMDPELWYPVSSKVDPVVARETCRECPVREACLEWALRMERAAGYSHGVWGGLTAAERTQLLGRRPPAWAWAT